MKTILVDAMGAYVYEGEGVYQPLHELLESYPNKKIVLTMAPDDLMKKWGLDTLPYDVFTSRLDPKKVDPLYYEHVLSEYKLAPSDVVYCEHDKLAVESARSLGIVTHWYDSDARDLDALKAFLDKNLS
jgi:FMN phosphatase YigB (HAD superfamily)